MVSRVLVPMDDSEMAERALEYALEVHDDADVTVLNVVGVPSPFMGEAVSIVLEEDVEEAAARRAAAVLDRAEELAAEHGREIDTVVDVGRPGRAIVERADGFDVLVLGSHGGDVTDRLYVGNVAKTVFERSPVPVTVVR